MANAALIKSALGGSQNGYLGIFLLPGQYYRLADTPFILLPEPGRTETVPEWKLTGE